MKESINQNHKISDGEIFTSFHSELFLTRTQDYNIYARRTSYGPVPGVQYLQYGTCSQVPDSYAYWFLFIVPEPAHGE